MFTSKDCRTFSGLHLLQNCDGRLCLFRRVEAHTEVYLSIPQPTHREDLPSHSGCFRWTPHPVIVTIGDNRDYIRVLVYSYYTTITGWGVLLTDITLPSVASGKTPGRTVRKEVSMRKLTTKQFRAAMLPHRLTVLGGSQMTSCSLNPALRTSGRPACSCPRVQASAPLAVALPKSFKHK